MKKFFFRLSMLAGIAFFSQLPLFVDQYQLRLDGHLSECNRQIEAYRQAAKDSDKTLSEYTEKFISSDDSDFHREGVLINDLVSRGEFLQKATTSLKESSLIFRPFVFIRYADERVVVDAWKSYSPGFSFTLDGLVWSAFGALVGILIFSGCKSLLNGTPKDKKIA